MSGVPSPARTASTSIKRSILGNLVRPWLLRLLDRLDDGQLELVDPLGRRRLGSDARDLEAGGESQTTTDLCGEVEIADTGVYPRLIWGGSIGAAETYAERRWSSQDLTSVIRLLARNRDVGKALDGPASRLLGLTQQLRHRWRTNTRRQSQRNIGDHYDLGNDFFETFLDPTLTYSCAVFPTPDADLETASRHKLDLICRKLDLQPDDRLLEIGTGWGSLCLHAASAYGCQVVTTTISREQYQRATERVQAAGLCDRIRIEMLDYRDLPDRYPERFDKLVSVEMIEAVGRAFLPRYFEIYDELLIPGGRGLIQAIVIDDDLYASYATGVDFIQRYIFPGGFLPSVAIMRELTARTALEVVKGDDITHHYPPTLRAWRAALHRRWFDLISLGYPDRLLRLWDYYFCYSEGGFLERTIGDVQVTLTKPRSPSP